MFVEILRHARGTRLWLQTLPVVLAAALAACSGGSSAPASVSTGGTATSRSDSTSGVSPSGAARASDSAAPPIHVVAAWVAITPGMAPVMMAEEGGYFKEQGLDVDLRHINGSTTGMASLLSGELQVLQASANVVVTSAAEGAKLRVVSGFVNQSTLLAMTVPTITDPSQLKGTTWAVTVLGGLDYFDLVTMLQHFGLTANDVKIITAGDVPGQLAAVVGKRAQGITVSPPNNVLAEKDAGMRQFFDVGTLPPIQNTGLIVSETTFQSNKEMLRRFIQACIEGIHRFKSDETFGEQVLTKYLKYSEPAITKAGWEYYSKAFTKEPYTTVLGMQRLIEETATTNPKVSSLHVNTLVDSSIVDDIVKSGFVTKIYGS